jgi:hypothetical protein
MTPDLSRLDRRTAIKWMLTAAASTTLLGRASSIAAAPADAGNGSAHGYGTDPDQHKNKRPGDVWPQTLTDAQRAVAGALCAVIIPADGRSPSAADLRVHDFIDEWISAPYPAQAADRPLVLAGLDWLDTEARRRFGRGFAALSDAQKTALCDEISDPKKDAAATGTDAEFFLRFRELTAGGYYTTPEGMKDIGYVGNIALATFEGPPADVRRKLGLA